MNGARLLAPASGIYGVFRLDGAPVNARDAAALGVRVSEPASFEATGIDTRAPQAVYRADDSGGVTILVGYIEEAAVLARRLSLSQNTPLALIARAALVRFGSATPSELTGEWSLLHFDRREDLTLMTSAARRDRMFYAVSGPRVAVAPDLFRLSKISWVGTKLDEAGLLFGLARGDLRGAMGDQTMLPQVRQLEPGSSVVFTTAGVRKSTADVFPPQERWRGSFEDAMAEAGAVIGKIMRSRLARTNMPAVMLSGGLDSSTLAFFAAQQRSKSQPLLLLTSVAPPGSGLVDEARFADSVAARLGVEIEHVWPAEDASIYRPPDFILGGAGGPPLTTRHCLTETFQSTARKRGATMLLDGTWGEMTVTGYGPPQATEQRLRAGAAWTRRMLARVRGAAPTPQPFHVRLAPDKTANLPEAVKSNLAIASRTTDADVAGLWGYQFVIKAMRHANEFYGGAIRAEFPYRDLRLLRLFAGFPAEFMSHGGIDRAAARHLLKDRLPDCIRLRTSGGAASPDHLQRMRRQAQAARARIARFRAAEVDEWLDLDWLDRSLVRVSANGPKDYCDSNEVQLTAITAEFLTWWRARS